METGCVPDPRTMHESETAVDRKYIVQQFIWPLPIDSGGLDASSVHADVRSNGQPSLQRRGAIIPVTVAKFSK